jgi:quinol monooxygenase YgiN
MVKVIAKNYVKLNKVKEVLELAEELVHLAVKENGCIKYEMYQDENDENILTMIEEWQNKEILKAHMASEHFQRIVPEMNKLMEKPGDINIYKKVI